MGKPSRTCAPPPPRGSVSCRAGRGRKTDALDAAAAAGIAALQGDAAQLQPEDATVVLAVLEERRSNLVGQRTRSVNQLHAVLRELIPGGAPRKLRAARSPPDDRRGPCPQAGCLGPGR